MGSRVRRRIQRRAIGRQIAACDSKVAFATLGKAEIFANRHERAMRAYSCPICGQWHLTSQVVANG